MKITHLGLMPINLVVELSLGQHLHHLVGRKFWSALKILALVLARIHPERNPHTLGRQYCEVVVKVVLKRDALLPRPYVGVEKMADAKHLSIAWPYNWLKLSKTSKSAHDTGVCNGS